MDRGSVAAIITASNSAAHPLDDSSVISIQIHQRAGLHDQFVERKFIAQVFGGPDQSTFPRPSKEKKRENNHNYEARYTAFKAQET